MTNNMANFIGHIHRTNDGYIYKTILIQPIIQPTDNYIANYITNHLDLKIMNISNQLYNQLTRPSNEGPNNVIDPSWRRVYCY